MRKRKGVWKKCRKCGLEWNTSTLSDLDEKLYVCPKCRGVRMKYIDDGHVRGVDIGSR